MERPNTRPLAHNLSPLVSAMTISLPSKLAAQDSTKYILEQTSLVVHPFLITLRVCLLHIYL